MHRLALAVVAAAALFVAPLPGARAAVVEVRPGDGTLQAALDAAQDGDVLELRAGVYRGNFTRANIANLTIRGRGKVIIDGADLGEDTSGEVFEFTNVNGLTIEGLTIRNAADDGVFLRNCSNFTARRCRFDNCDDSGIEDRNTAGYVIDRCVFTRCSWALALGYSSSASGVSVTRSTFSAIGSYAIDLNASDAVIERNSFSKCEGRGVYLRDGFTGATVTNNRFVRIARAAIDAQGEDSTITRNKVQKGGDDGIVLAGDGGHTASNNLVKGCVGNGVVVNSTGNTLTANRASGNGSVEDETFDLLSTESEDANTYEGNRFGRTSFPQIQ